MHIGEVIKEFREHKKMTQSSLASRSDLTAPMISLIESGKRSPTLKSLEDIATALEVPSIILVYGTLSSKDKDKIPRSLNDELLIYYYSKQ